MRQSRRESLGVSHGVNLRLIQEWLGHSSPATTSVYTHLTVKAEQLGAVTINQLMSDL